VEHIPEQRAIHAALDHPLEPKLAGCLEDNGIKALYSHQARA
jgi:hypothetical protein